MRSLKICTQRIFNNLIKQNEKLASDFVLKQSTIVSSVQSVALKVQRRESSVQHPESNVQSPALRVQRPGSRVQSPASNACVQSPGIQVCLYYLPLMEMIDWNLHLIVSSLQQSWEVEKQSFHFLWLWFQLNSDLIWFAFVIIFDRAREANKFEIKSRRRRSQILICSIFLVLFSKKWPFR